LRLAKWGSGIGLLGSNREPLMSALGQKQAFNDGCPMSALPPKADIRTDDQGFRLPSNFEWLICGAFTLEHASPWPN
jgi:hypothetical protein